MLAENRDEFGFHVRIVPLPVAFDPDPVDRPALRRFLFPGNADIIFRMAGDDAGFATGAAVEIDDHFPFMRAGFRAGPPSDRSWTVSSSSGLSSAMVHLSTHLKSVAAD